jgi:hypothetical protein
MGSDMTRFDDVTIVDDPVTVRFATTRVCVEAMYLRPELPLKDPALLN